MPWCLKIVSTKSNAVSSSVISTATGERCTILLNWWAIISMPASVVLDNGRSGVCEDGAGFMIW
uniref:Uncharacterized protein n=1 Tax=Hyaloperonospora arabidopsidis (strain Emoy2) TaxID=559515 RepID=M4BC12_HYAAE